MAYDIMKCKNRKEVYNLLRKMYYEGKAGKPQKAILRMPNKDRMEIFANLHGIFGYYVSGINPNDEIIIHPDILSLVVWKGICIKSNEE